MRKRHRTIMLTQLTTTAIILLFPRLIYQAVAQHNSTCDCDCSLFPAATSCKVGRLVARSDCPCCQTCLRQAGELCDPVAFPCDTEFGLNCSIERNLCEGPYSLHAATVTHNSLELTWRRPANNQGQLYFFYTTKYNNDLRQWSMQEVTGDTRDFIHGLQAATSYYVSIVPEWRGLFRFENRSEILVARTEGCLNKNRSFAVGETFADGCKYNCTCTQEGLLACVERKCPLGYKKGDIQDPLCKENDDPLSEDPCCVVYTCQHGDSPPVTTTGSDDFCVHKGKKYPLAADFYEDNCTSACYCDEIGVVECRPVKCPVAAAPLNSSGSCLEWSVKQQGAPVPPNCCPNITCINDGTCSVNGTKYANGAQIPSPCDQHCSCRAGKVVCEPTCLDAPAVPPTDPFCAKHILVRDDALCCSKWKCNQTIMRQADSCIHNGMQFHLGDKWSDTEHCRQRNCSCRQNSAGFSEAVCVGGCPMIRSDDLVSRPGCVKPFLHKPDDQSCVCPTIKCASERADDAPVSDEVIFDIHAVVINSSSVEVTLNISSSLPRDLEAVLETHIAHLDTTAPRNASDVWQVSATKLQRVEPVISEFITGFQDNATYRLRARLILTDPSSGEDVVLPFSQTVLFTVPPKGCNVNGSMFAEGAILPGGCGQECVCRRGQVLCRPVHCDVQEAVLLPSEFCPVPVLVKAPLDCCPRWECHPSSTGCRLGDAIYSHGDQWRNGCAEECSCRHGRIVCRNLCEDLQKTVPHPSCRSITVAGSCCPVWRCHEGAAVPVLDFTHETDNAAMNLTVNEVTSTKARLTWDKPAELKGVFGFTLLVEEAVLDRESFRDASLIHPDVREYTLRDLSPGVRYKATLRAVEDGDRVVSSQSVHFQTLELSDVKISVWLGFIGNDRAEAVWDCLQCEDLKNLKLNLLSSSNPGPAIGDVTPGLPKITLTELNPKENYQLWLEGNTSGGAVVKSNVLAFTTRATADFNEIPKEFQNQTTSHLALATPTEQKLSTALIIVSAMCAFFFLAFFMAIGVCLRYRRSSTIQKANPYQTYTDSMYK